MCLKICLLYKTNALAAMRNSTATRYLLFQFVGAVWVPPSTLVDFASTPLLPINPVQAKVAAFMRLNLLLVLMPSCCSCSSVRKLSSQVSRFKPSHCFSNGFY